MKIVRGIVLWLITSLLFFILVLGATPSPPLEGYQLVSVYLQFFSLVLLGPLSLATPLGSYFYPIDYPLGWIPIILGIFAIAVALIARRRKRFSLLAASLILWASSGALILFIYICGCI